MMIKEKPNLRENLILASFLAILCIIAATDTSKINVAIAYATLVFVYVNIKHFRPDNIGLGRIVRRFLYVLPLYLPLTTFRSFSMNTRILLLIAVGIFIGTIPHVINYRSWRLQFCKESISDIAKRDSLNLITAAIYTILTAVGEEIFFRGFLIGTVQKEYMFFMIPASALCFVACHACTQNNTRRWSDIFMETIFSVITGLMFVFGESIWPCITAHIAFNLPYAVVDVKAVIYKKRQGEKE